MSAFGPTTEADLREALRRAELLSGKAMALAVALDDFDAIELPPGAEGRVDQAQLRATASLYFAAELEAAGVLPAVEALVTLASTGALQIDLGGVMPRLRSFWERRNERMTPDERAAFFHRLFGFAAGPPIAGTEAESAFELDMIELCEALYKLDELAAASRHGGAAQQSRLRASALRMTGTIADAGTGMTAFAAQEILADLKQALALLGDAGLRSALGARDIWAVVRAIDRLARRRSGDVGLRLRRGRAGMMVLAWLAEAAPHLQQPAQPLLGLDHPVIEAAVDWLETSLRISETEAAPAVPPRSVSVPPTGLPWAAAAS